MTKVKHELLTELFDKIELEGLSTDELSIMLDEDIRRIKIWENKNQLPNIQGFSSLIKLVADDVTQMDAFKSSSIGGKMFLLRASIGLTLTDLSEAIMFSRELLSKWERGLKQPTAHDIVRFASFYGVKVELFGVQGIQYSIGYTIREERLANNMTQKGLADETKVSAGTISTYERGVVQPDSDTLNRIERALGLPKNYIKEAGKVGVI